MTKHMYAVIHFWYAENNKGRDNDAKVIGVFDDLKKAKRSLVSEAKRWMNEGYSALCEVDDPKDWKPGYSTDEDGSSWSLCKFNDTEAWAQSGDGSNFEKVEILDITKRFKFKIR